MVYCECDNCGYIADVPYMHGECPKCHKGKMRGMELTLVEKLKPLFRTMKQDVTNLKQAVDDLYTSIDNLTKTIENISRTQ